MEERAFPVFQDRGLKRPVTALSPIDDRLDVSAALEDGLPEPGQRLLLLTVRPYTIYQIVCVPLR
jgi:hypothetical protein